MPRTTTAAQRLDDRLDYVMDSVKDGSMSPQQANAIINAAALGLRRAKLAMDYAKMKHFEAEAEILILDSRP